MIKITQRNKKWLIEIQETWEWENKQEMEENLKELIKMKSLYGQLTN